MEYQSYAEEFVQVAQQAGFTAEEINSLLMYADHLHRHNLPIIFDQYHLSLLLGYDYEYLLAVTNHQQSHYKHFSLPKKHGGVRPIEEPYPSLKEVQTWILRNILEPSIGYSVSPVAKAFMPKKSLRENARFHKNKQTVIALDLHDFFGSVRYSQVFNVFKTLGYSIPVSVMLTKLCMLRGSLPQGAPTSPMLSNFIFKQLDDRIFKYCKLRHIMYTRYADDLTFSGTNISINHLIAYVKMIVSTQGFQLNQSKTKVMGRGMCQSVTGIVVNEILQVSKKYRDTIRKEVYYSIKFGIKDHMSKIELPLWCNTEKLYLHHLLGRIEYVLAINPKDMEFVRYANWAKSLLSCY